MSHLYEQNMYYERRRNIIRTWVIVFFFLAFVLAVGYAFAVYYQDVTILMIAFVAALVGNLSSYFFSDKIALSMNNAKPAQRDNPQHLQLIRTVENMAITAGMPTPRVYVIDDPAPNAFATGRNERHAAVACTTGLLSLLEKNELEGVVAHELSHIKNSDILVATIVVIMVGFIAILADLFMRVSLTQKRDNQDGKAFAIIMIVGIVVAILAPIAAKLIQLAVSRKREFLADASGALLTRYPEGLAHALVKINNAARPMSKPSSATSHMFLANPFGKEGGVRGFTKKLFSTHPPMEERVEALLGQRGVNELVENNGNNSKK